MNRNDLRAIADVRLIEAKALLNKKLYDGAYYLAGYAVEGGLKSCIAKKTRRYDFPDRRIVNDSYTHDLNQLIKVSGLQGELELEMQRDKDFEVDWAIVKIGMRLVGMSDMMPKRRRACTRQWLITGMEF